MYFDYKVKQILSGERTQARIPAAEADTADYAHKDPQKRASTVYHPSGRVKFKVGHVYAVQQRGLRQVLGRIRLTGIHMELAGAIPEADVSKEGFPNRAAYLAIWSAVHGPDAIWLPVWVLDFELVVRYVPPE